MDENKLINDLHFMQQAYATLFSVANKIQVRSDEVMENITSRQLMTLIAIAHLPREKTTLKNIAKMLGTTKQTANKLVTSLKSKRYIETKSSKTDKRAINIEITQVGKNIMFANSEKSIYFFADMFHEFTSDEIELLWKMLNKLYRFDGEEQGSFEEQVDFDPEGSNLADKPDYQQPILEKFARRRSDDIEKEKLK